MEHDEPDVGVAHVRRLMAEAENLENGPTKVAILEEAVRLADSLNDLDLAYAARQQVVVAANFGGCSDRAIVAFSWCLAQSDKHPDRFNLYELLWRYKWVVANTACYANVPRKSIDLILADMERRFVEYGAGMYAVHQSRRGIMMTLGELEEAKKAAIAMKKSPPSPLGNCEACECNSSVYFHLILNRPKIALKTAQPILAGRMSCSRVPHTTYSNVMLPLLFAGRVDEAIACHRKGYRLIGVNPDFLGDSGDHILFLAVTDNLELAAKALERHLPNALASRELISVLDVYRAAWFLCERFKKKNRAIKLRVPRTFPIKSEKGKFEPNELGQWFYEQSVAIAARFDERNGNSYRMDKLNELRKLHRRVKPYPVTKHRQD